MSGKLLTGPAAIIARAAVAVLIIGCAILVAFGVVPVVPGLVAAGILIAAAVLFTVDLTRITRVSASKDGFSFEQHVAEAQVAAAGAPPEENERGMSEPLAEPAGELTELRLHLEAKLSYIAGRMDLESGAVSIGSLRYDGYLTDEEARTADLLLRTPEAEFARASPEQREAFLEAAGSLVGSIRASVLAGAVQKQLKRDGWIVERADSGKRDLLVRRDGGLTALVVPVFAVAPNAELPAKVATRLSRLDRFDRRVIVLPDNSGAPTTPGADPAIVKLGELKQALTADAARRE